MDRSRFYEIKQMNMYKSLKIYRGTLNPDEMDDEDRLLNVDKYGYDGHIKNNYCFDDLKLHEIATIISYNSGYDGCEFENTVTEKEGGKFVISHFCALSSLKIHNATFAKLDIYGDGAFVVDMENDDGVFTVKDITINNPLFAHELHTSIHTDGDSLVYRDVCNTISTSQSDCHKLYGPIVRLPSMNLFIHFWKKYPLVVQPHMKMTLEFVWDCVLACKSDFEISIEHMKKFNHGHIEKYTCSIEWPYHQDLKYVFKGDGHILTACEYKWLQSWIKSISCSNDYKKIVRLYGDRSKMTKSESSFKPMDFYM